MSARPRKVYVVTQPPAARGIYETWPACQAAVRGVTGARFQAVSTRAEAEAMLSGEGTALPAGLWAFVDGNHEGGVGVVLVEERPDASREVQEVSTHVVAVFAGAGLQPLDSPSAITRELGRLRNVLAELAGLHHALAVAPAGRAMTVVHDYAGVSAWFEGRWRARDPVVLQVMDRCRHLAHERRLQVTFRHQPGHRSTWAGRDDFAHFNGRADALATRGARDLTSRA